MGKRWTYERFLYETNTLIDKGNYIFTNYESINSSTSKFSVACQQCGHKWITTVATFFNQGSRCYNCNHGVNWSKKRVEQEYLLTDDYAKFSLTIDNEIKNAVSIFSVKCLYGHQWETTPNTYFTKGRRCPICRQSRGEESIALFLEKHRIMFERQKRFDTCKNINTLPFDFFLKDYRLILEHHGRQHYEPVNFGSDKSIEKAKENLLDIQKRDAIKKQWAIDNGYRFLEISYKEINQIEDILSKELGI